MNNRYDILNKIQFDLECGPKSDRGIFLKLNRESNKSINYTISVKPNFLIEFGDKDKLYKSIYFILNFFFK